MKARDITLFATMAACAMVLGYVERWIPMPGLPGVKLGLANLVVVMMLKMRGAKSAAFISFVKVFMTALLFTGFFAFWYSLAGSILSWVGMCLLSRNRHIGITMVSAVGGVLHNIGQLLVAWMVLGTSVCGYAPLLLVAGAVMGFINGCVAYPVLVWFRRNSSAG